MSSVRAFKRNRKLPIKANVITPYYPILGQRGHAANAVVITNKTTVTLYVAEHDRPDLDYDLAIPPGSAGPLVNPEGIGSLYMVASADGFFDATEVSTDAPDLQFQVWNMQFTATSPLPTGFNIIGRTITQNATGDINVGNPLHVVGTGAGGSTPADVTDRIARLLGHVIVDTLPAADITDRMVRLLGHVIVDALPAADVTDRAARALGLVGPAAGSVWDIADRAARALGLVGPAAGTVWDIADRAARALGLVGPAAGSVWDIADRAARALGKAGIQVAGADVSQANPVPVKPANGVTPAKFNAAAAGEVVIKNAAGRLFAFVSDVAGTLRNGTGAPNDVWVVPANVLFTPQRPLEFGTDIRFNASAAGNIYVQSE